MLPFKLFLALSKKERIILSLALALFALSGSLKTAAFVSQNTEIAPSRGGELREGMLGQPVSINPVMPVNEVDQSLAELTFASLTQIADSIKTVDGKTWSVRLKENALWHDGKRLTSDDVIFTVETIQNQEAHSPLYRSFQGIVAERVSELEVKFVLPSPYAFFEEDHLNSLRIIPKHIFADIPVQNFKLSAYDLKPIGSGPYKVVAYNQDRSGFITNLYLEENETYFGEKTNISKITFKFYKTNLEILAAYNGAGIDAFGLNMPENIANKIKIRSDINYFKSSRYYAVFINAIEGPKDTKIRGALSGTVDRDALVNEVLGGHARPFYGPTALTPNPVTQFDVQSLKGTEFTLTVPEEDFLVKTAEMVKANWEANGAKINLKITPLKDIQEEVLKNNDYQMILFGNIVKESQDLFSFWHSSQRFYPGQNLSLYQNSKVDSLLETYRRNFDPDERAVILKKASDAIAGDLPAIFLYSPDYVYVSTPNLRGLNKDKTINVPSDLFSDVAEWYVKTKRIFKS